MTTPEATPRPASPDLREALEAAFHAMTAACKWAAGETAGVKTIEDADRHTRGYDALLDATVRAGQAAGILSGGVVASGSPSIDAIRMALDDLGWTGLPKYAIAYAAAIRDVRALLDEESQP